MEGQIRDDDWMGKPCSGCRPPVQALAQLIQGTLSLQSQSYPQDQPSRVPSSKSGTILCAHAAAERGDRLANTCTNHKLSSVRPLPLCDMTVRSSAAASSGGTDHPTSSVRLHREMAWPTARKPLYLTCVTRPCRHFISAFGGLVRDSHQPPLRQE